MFKNAPALLTAFSLSATAALPNAAAAENNGLHQWSDPSRAEFTVPNVRTKLLVPNVHYTTQDVHVDCDLMINANDKAIVPIGFIGQFNAETEATISALSPTALQAIENWKGSLDYRKSSQTGVLAHLTGQHEISMAQVGQAAQRCWSDFRGNAVDLNDLPTHGATHNDYD